jgi:hypothetical protein
MSLRRGSLDERLAAQAARGSPRTSAGRLVKLRQATT